MELSHATHKPLQPGQEVSTSGEILGYAATNFPDKTGLICGARRWTFTELDRLANQFARALIGYKADRDGPVGIMSKNNGEYAIAHFGTARSGRYAVHFPTRCTQEDLINTVNRTRPAVLIVDGDCAQIVGSARTQFEHPPHILAIGDHSALSGFWQFLAGQSETLPDLDIDPDALGSVIFTGGTTGRPKGVLSSQRARAISAMAAIEDFRIGSELIAGYPVPFTHTAGLFSWLQPAILAGCTGVVIPRWQPEMFMALTEEYGINMIFAVPAQLATLLAHPAFKPERLRSLQTIAFGGAPLAASLIERAEEAMPWMVCGRAYGSSETGHLAAQFKADRVVAFDCYNQPGGRLEIEIFKAPGVIAEVGEIGEVATRGGHLMTGYLDDQDAEREFFKTDNTDGKWGWMGDLAVKHEGYFSLAGRSKHMIVSGGLNIFPAELEDILYRHPDVEDCAVFGIEDRTWGELPAAAVVAKSTGIEADAVMDFVAGAVARYKRLRKVYVVDAIPRTAAGKAQINLLKDACLKLDAATALES